ncbi:LOW QUALITY PROTEIN: hypothetical protein ACHAW6_005743 [Cyclotella cf. meneghiniana]
MMHPNTQNPNLSAHESMEGMFSFDATPMGPIGTECMIHIMPTRCHTWGYHSMKAWYFAPAINHYRFVKVVTDVGTVRITDTFKFLHHTLPVPTILPTNRICQFTPGLRQHKWPQITFIVDDFGIKTVGFSHTKHLKQALEKYYEVTVD